MRRILSRLSMRRTKKRGGSSSMSSSSNVCGVYPRHTHKHNYFGFLIYSHSSWGCSSDPHTCTPHATNRVLTVHARASIITRINEMDVGITGLEASRAPYSKSHARRLKRKEKEQLTGRLGSLKAALPSIAPTTTRTAATVDGRSAEEVDAAAATNTNTTTTTATAVGGGATVKPTKPITSDQWEAPPPRSSRPGQIGEGNGAPLTRSQRRRALYGLIIVSCHFAFCN